MKTDNTIRELLSICGFSESERLVLAALVERGPGSAGVLAKRAGLKRPTVYAVLENLIGAGFVERSRRDKLARFAALSPDVLPRVIESRARHRFEEIREAVKLMTDSLSRLPLRRGREFGDFEIATLESNEAVYIQLRDTLLGGDYAAIFNPQLTLVGEGQELVADFLRSTAETRPRIREIIVKGPKADWYKRNIRNENHLIKEIPKGQKIRTDMIFLNGSIVLSHYGAQKEMAIKITHAAYYQSMMTVFEMLWSGL